MNFNSSSFVKKMFFLMFDERVKGCLNFFKTQIPITILKKWMEAV